MAIPMQKGRLGRGLASLIGEAPQSESRLPLHGEHRLLSIDQLHPSGLNPRKDFDSIELVDLANSIRAKGLVQPIVARPDPAGGYEIVAGERRWRAAQKAALHTVPVIVRELSDQEVAEFAVIENVQRKDLNPIEEASGYHELIERFGYTQEDVADTVGKSRSHLTNMLRLLKLPAGVQDLVRSGKLTSGHARALVGREDAEPLARRILEEDMTVRQVEALVGAAKAERAGGTAEPGSRDAKEKDADTKSFEKDLSDALGLKVELKPGSGESGLITIEYGNFEQLDYIKLRLIGTPSY
jgi:ParB family transcriptional regulator, chromosome partitioning protein